MPPFNSISILEFEDSKKEEQFKEFIKFLNGDINNENWLEIASSIHLFRRLYPQEGSQEIIKRVMEKNEKFKNMEDEIKIISAKIEKEGLIKW